jgi:hypothetical protein
MAEEGGGENQVKKETGDAISIKVKDQSGGEVSKRSFRTTPSRVEVHRRSAPACRPLLCKRCNRVQTPMYGQCSSCRAGCVQVVFRVKGHTKVRSGNDSNTMPPAHNAHCTLPRT